MWDAYMFVYIRMDLNNSWKRQIFVRDFCLYDQSNF